MSAKTDRELLELAARAVGYDTSHPMNHERLSLDPPVDSLWVSADGKLAHTAWNPLTDDGCALRLAVKLSLLVSPVAGKGGSAAIAGGVYIYEPHGSDSCAATRRAIVRAAADIGAKS